MKIDKINIIKMCNMSHPDFGIFAKFLDGLGKDGTIDVPQPTQMFLCDVCTRWEWLCRRCHMNKDGRINNLIQYSLCANTCDIN